MKTVRDACHLQDNALSITLSDQIEQLDELITIEGDGTSFFEKTFITQGMLDLISEGTARLAGHSSQAIFHLKQAMGGGKTHLLVGFGLLAKHPSLRQRYCADVAFTDAFDTADIAAFNGRNNPDHFFWGEIAEQLRKGDLFRGLWTGGPKAPDEKDWLKLFEGDRPILILLDEMPPYFHYLDTQKVGNVDDFVIITHPKIVGQPRQVHSRCTAQIQMMAEVTQAVQIQFNHRGAMAPHTCQRSRQLDGECSRANTPYT